MMMYKLCWLIHRVFFRPHKRLERAMVSAAWGGAKSADVLLVLIDAQSGLSDEVDRMLDIVNTMKQEKSSCAK